MMNEMGKGQGNPLRAAAAAGAVALMLGVFTAPAGAQPREVRVTFDAAGCPLGVSAPVITAQRGKQVRWQAVDVGGNESTERFGLYFDPLQGGGLHGGNGAITRPIDSRAPYAEYKYTIVGERCPDRPLDPVIRVAR